LTHNNAIAGFTNQSLGLPAYACKTDSSTEIKLALRMHQNLPFSAKESKTFLGRGHSHFTRPVGRGTPVVKVALDAGGRRPPTSNIW